MNLRLDSASVRLRVTHLEAMRLASEGRISQRFFIFEDDFELRLSIGASLGYVSGPHQKYVEFFVSPKNLETILTAFKNSARPKKEDCLVKGNFNLGGRPVEICIEVDRLSLI